MANRTEYRSVRFRDPARVQAGKTRTEIEALGGVRLVRVTDEQRDDLLVITNGVNGAEVPWTNIASAIRAVEPAKDKAVK